MNILCTICVRGGSSSIKNKNIKNINGKPLIYYTIKQAQKSKIFKRIVVSTDSKKIQNIVSKYGIKNFFIRPKNLSTNNAPKIPVIRHALKQSENFFKEKFDIICDLDVTSPLRLTKDIKDSIKKFLAQKKNLMVSANESRSNPYFNSVIIDKKKNIRPFKKLGFKIKRRQDAPKTYDLNGSIYLWKRSALLKYDSLYIKNNSIYVMPNTRGLDIDTPEDFKIVSYLLKNELYQKV